MSRVHVLVTVLNRDLFEASWLVFKTLRIGFPTAEVVIYGHGLDQECERAISEATARMGFRFVPIPMDSHGAWIERLLARETGPFWICDTDMIFLRPVEHWFLGSQELFAGRLEPEFFEQWTQSVHMERLHPSLIWFNPAPLRAAMRGWPGTQEFFRTVNLPLIQWSCVPRRGQPPLFYDTTAGLWHALEGKAFTEEQNEAFEHLFCGTYSDQNIAVDLRPTHEAVFRDLNAAKGLWGKQQLWYQQNSLYSAETQAHQ